MKIQFERPEPQDFLEDETIKYLVSKDRMKQFLKQGVVTVTFSKVNGDTRKMNCTLLPEYLPKQDISNLLVEQRNQKTDNPSTIAVWDVDARGWRSFRLDSVHKVEIEDKVVESD